MVSLAPVGCRCDMVDQPAPVGCRCDMLGQPRTCGLPLRYAWSAPHLWVAVAICLVSPAPVGCRCDMLGQPPTTGASPVAEGKTSYGLVAFNNGMASIPLLNAIHYLHKKREITGCWPSRYFTRLSRMESDN